MYKVSHLYKTDIFNSKHFQHLLILIKTRLTQTFYKQTKK